MWSFLPAWEGRKQAALQQAFFLSVSPKSFLQSLLREGSWAVFGL